MAIQSIPQSFTVSSIGATGIPTIASTWNQFDEHGLTLSLRRLVGETNASYRKRVFDVLVHQANSTYKGLVYGLTRELGLELFYPIEITPVFLPNGSVFAPDPYVEFSESMIRLYSNYSAKTLDREIDRYTPGGNYEHIGQLVDYINTYSTFYNATLMNESYRWTRSMTILNQSNREENTVSVERSTKWQLEHKYLIKDTSVFFNDTTAYANSTNSAVDISRLGDYHVDNTSGIVSSYSIPTRSAELKYEYMIYPFRPIASPVIINSISSDDFKREMFEEIILDNGSGTAHGLATVLGVKILNELLSVQPMYWGV